MMTKETDRRLILTTVSILDRGFAAGGEGGCGDKASGGKEGESEKEEEGMEKGREKGKGRSINMPSGGGTRERGEREKSFKSSYDDDGHKNNSNRKSHGLRMSIEGLKAKGVIVPKLLLDGKEKMKTLDKTGWIEDEDEGVRRGGGPRQGRNDSMGVRRTDGQGERSQRQEDRGIAIASPTLTTPRYASRKSVMTHRNEGVNGADEREPSRGDGNEEFECGDREEVEEKEGMEGGGKEGKEGNNQNDVKNTRYGTTISNAASKERENRNQDPRKMDDSVVDLSSAMWKECFRTILKNVTWEEARAALARRHELRKAIPGLPYTDDERKARQVVRQLGAKWKVKELQWEDGEQESWNGGGGGKEGGD